MTCPICNAEPCSCVPVEKWPEPLRKALYNEYHGFNTKWGHIHKCYSTKEAAIAAKEKK